MCFCVRLEYFFRYQKKKLKKDTVKMRIIVTGGGTGGHINPAIAIADALRQTDKDCEILFVGTPSGMENRLVVEAGYPIWHIDVEGIRRSLSIRNAFAAVKAIRAVGKAREIIKKFRPDAAVGTGGYVCYPMIRACSDMGIYTALHESNAIPGLAVRVLKKRTDRIFVNFPECIEALGVPEKTLRCGNPLRKGLERTKRAELREKYGITGRYRYVILSFGGSLGASALNTGALDVMERLSSKRGEILHVHACGRNGQREFFERFCALGLDKCKNIRASEYISDMPEWMNVADVVVSRSGAMTLSEIASAGRASVLIPSPNVVDDHQYKNAKAFSDAGAAYLVTEGSEDMSRLPEIVDTVLSDRRVRFKMEERASAFDVPNAGRTIAEEILKGIEEKKRG